MIRNSKKPLGTLERILKNPKGNLKEPQRFYILQKIGKLAKQQHNITKPGF